MDNRHAIEGAYDAFQRCSADEFIRVLHADAEGVEDFPYGRPAGPEAALSRIFLGISTEWDDCHLDLDEVLDAGDRIIALGSYRGRDRQSGRSMLRSFAHVWTLENGHVVKFTPYTGLA
jgi:ketosteroid isomerase-like protein